MEHRKLDIQLFEEGVPPGPLLRPWWGFYRSDNVSDIYCIKFDAAVLLPQTQGIFQNQERTGLYVDTRTLVP